ncbi:hypothetical protein CEXT_537551 [Caerostris extrusa]|uniref:Uncharacterized protein n=1 Tax=Caerostris extrusa TaxID=172846 RepID=A0AAV4UE97_CAEEX|nr:hypothetical protein CEXT_537551 [Caerostris extrusa]
MLSLFQDSMRVFSCPNSTVVGVNLSNNLPHFRRCQTIFPFVKEECKVFAVVLNFCIIVRKAHGEFFVSASYKGILLQLQRSTLQRPLTSITCEQLISKREHVTKRF